MSLPARPLAMLTVLVLLAVRWSALLTATLNADLARASGVDRDLEQPTTAADDPFERRHVVIIQSRLEGEAGAQRRGP